MKNIFYLFFGVFILSTSVAQTPKKQFEGSITEEDLRTYLTYIASDELEGRDTGSEGQRKAAEYIIKHLQEWNLAPIVKTDKGNSYLQTFNLYQSEWGEAYIKVGGKQKAFFKDYIPSGFVYVPTEKKYDVVFVGYGIQEGDFDDYKGLDVKGKAIAYISGEPKSADGTYRYSKSDKSLWDGNQGIRRKLKLASDLGAAAVVEISSLDADAFKTAVAARKAILTRNARMSIEKNPAATPSALPSITVSKALGAELIGVKAKKFDQYLAGNTAGFKSKPKTLTLKSDRVEKPVETSNVMGFLEGTDKKDEVLVITAHYDHVGIDEKGQIYNGADDDGSGTCGVMEIAQAFSKAKAAGHGPRRSILFLWVTGEEKGLLGSEYFADKDPVIPLKQIIANLNIDMIGRVDKKHENNPDYTYIIGSDKLSSELHAISEAANKESVNLELDYEFNDPEDKNKFYYRSDHYNFAKNKIPIAFYFTGVHEDYHQPTDDVEKILFPRYAKIVKLVYNTAWELVNREGRIVVDSNKP